jgi:hypothetical protein
MLGSAVTGRFGPVRQPRPSHMPLVFEEAPKLPPQPGFRSCVQHRRRCLWSPAHSRANRRRVGLDAIARRLPAPNTPEHTSGPLGAVPVRSLIQRQESHWMLLHKSSLQSLLSGARLLLLHPLGFAQDDSAPKEIQGSTKPDLSVSLTTRFAKEMTDAWPSVKRLRDGSLA